MNIVIKIIIISYIINILIEIVGHIIIKKLDEKNKKLMNDIFKNKY